MEPTNYPFGQENDLPNLHDYVPCLSSGEYGDVSNYFTIYDAEYDQRENGGGHLIINPIFL